MEFRERAEAVEHARRQLAQGVVFQAEDRERAEAVEHVRWQLAQGVVTQIEFRERAEVVENARRQVAQGVATQSEVRERAEAVKVALLQRRDAGRSQTQRRDRRQMRVRHPAAGADPRHRRHDPVAHLLGAVADRRRGSRLGGKDLQRQVGGFLQGVAPMPRGQPRQRPDVRRDGGGRARAPGHRHRVAVDHADGNRERGGPAVDLAVEDAYGQR